MLDSPLCFEDQGFNWPTHNWAVNRLRNLIFFFTVHSPGIKWKKNSVDLFFYLLSKTHLDRIIRKAELTSTWMCSTVLASISRHIIYSGRKMTGLFVSVVGKSHFYVIESKAWFKRRISHAPNQILILVDSNEYVRLIWFKRRIVLPNKIAERE